MMGEHSSTDDLEVPFVVQRVGRRRPWRRGFRYEQQIARSEREAERRPAGRRVRRSLARDTVFVDRIDIELAGALLGHDEFPTVRAERHFRRTGGGGGE